MGLECRPQASFVERAVVGDQRQTVEQGGDLRPHFGEVGSLYRVVVGKPVDAGAEIGVVVGPRPDQPVDFVAYCAVADHHYADAADARPLSVGRFKIDRCEILHGGRCSCLRGGFPLCKANEKTDVR